MTQGWRIEYEGAFFITFYLVAMKSRISLSMIKDENIETVLSRATGINQDLTPLFPIRI